ncbi:MAG: hypothetical protein VW258_14865, partial [Thalassolituus sp.]
TGHLLNGFHPEFFGVPFVAHTYLCLSHLRTLGPIPEGPDRLRQFFKNSIQLTIQSVIKLLCPALFAEAVVNELVVNNDFMHQRAKLL